ALLLLAAAPSSCRKKQAAPVPVPEIPVVAAAAVVADVPVHREYPASVMSMRTVVLEARVEGWLLQQKVADGSMVEPGQVIYEIDPAPFIVSLDQARANLAVAIAQEADARQKYERNKPLVEVDAVSQEEFDSLEADYRAAQAQVLSNRAQVEQAELNLSYCTVISPAKGQLSKSQVWEGTLVGPSMNRTLNNVRQLDPVWIQFQPVSQDIPALRELMKSGAASTPTSMPGSDWSRTGKIVFIDNEVGARTSTIVARLEVPNPDLAIVPGAYVSVTLLVETLKGAITIPTDAIVYQSAQAMVWVIGADDAVKAVTIETGPQDGSNTVVKKGIAAGDRVVVKGQLKLKPGRKVVVEPAAKPSTQ
ncbi:MAG: efflux RND transporter periplasmic adaptor subunit, partial [Phycisphaerae bacterium]|nr:efflux RND transporter periplasmic adaptor subunit [Phycisphaerae bacterium]